MLSGKEKSNKGNRVFKFHQRVVNISVIANFNIIIIIIDASVATTAAVDEESSNTINSSFDD